jgi:hypothetical protein
MSDDITQRLADISQLMMEGQPFNDGDFTDIDAAIFEIERLRAEVVALKAQIAGEPPLEGPLDRLSRLDEEVGF